MSIRTAIRPQRQAVDAYSKKSGRSGFSALSVLLRCVSSFADGTRVAVAILLFAIALTSCADRATRPRGPSRDGETAVLPSVGHVAAILRGDPDARVRALVDRLEDQGPVQITLRRTGRRVQRLWVEDDDWWAALARAWERFEADAEVGMFDTLQIDLTHGWEPVALDSPRLTNVHRGVLGLAMRRGIHEESIGPSDMIARNLSVGNAVADFQRDTGLRDPRQPIELRSFEAVQLLVRTGVESEIDRMFRGNRYVPLADVRRDRVVALARGMGEWLVRQVQADGRMVYKYWPSSGSESERNNLIRQFMATICLGRWGRFIDDPSSADRVRRNLAYNFGRFYVQEGRLGLVEYEGKVKLGAVALAALAAIENATDARPSAELQGLLATVNAMWSPDGSFATWYRGRPPGSSPGHNFYPGEALLLWATIYERQHDAELLRRIRTSLRHYREWHRANRNPAFVPWHTQAYYKAWRVSRDPDFRDFIFEMNDWLCEYQQWDDAPYEDLRGRFYDPRRPGYGPPHASSTGVYLEGLIDAFALARAVGDVEREERYLRVIRRGLRSVMQLQFVDAIDLFYVSRSERVVGGIRTTVYDNELRIDNVQHNLMAVMKILETLDPADYGTAIRQD